MKHYLIDEAMLQQIIMAVGEASAWRASTAADEQTPEKDAKADADMAEEFEKLEARLAEMQTKPFTFADAVKTFAAPKDHWVHAALAEGDYSEEGVCEIDSDVVTSDGEDPGCYVMSWTWVEMPGLVAAEWKIGLLGEAFTSDSIGILKSNGWATPFETKNEQAISEGWEIFVTDRDTGRTYELQAINEAGVFEDDGDAWQFVYDKARAGSEYHRHALKALKGLNPDEYRELIKVCWEE